MPKNPTPPAVHNPRTLRAIAHPMRTRILDEISARGSMRAADVARELDIPANQASFHLRQLAKYGLIQEDVGAARDRRDRVWQLVSPQGFQVSLAELEKQPGGKAAASAFRRTAREWGHVVVDAAYSDHADTGVKRTVVDIPLRLTRTEATQFARELKDLTSRWQARTGESAGARTYTFLGVVVPRPAPEG